MAALAPHAASDVYESADEYDYVEFVGDANQHDWSRDWKTLAMTQSDQNKLSKWLDEANAAHNIRNNGWSLRGTPTHLNFKQPVAFGLIIRDILNAKLHGQDNIHHILLNMSGAAGTDMSRFLKTVKRFAKEELGRDGFVQEAAPSGTAAYLINETQHSFLNFPVVTSTFLPLHGELLKDIQDTFSNGGTLFVDWKSMVGEKLFTMVGKRLQEAHPHYTDKPFGNISVVTYWDFNQLVCDSPLFKANAVIPSGYNLYQLFDKTITFTELVRQQGADHSDCRAQLTRLGEGLFTEEDWMSWRFHTLTCFPQQ